MDEQWEAWFEEQFACGCPPPERRSTFIRREWAITYPAPAHVDSAIAQASYGFREDAPMMTTATCCNPRERRALVIGVAARENR